MSNGIFERALAERPGLLIDGKLHVWTDFLRPGPDAPSPFARECVERFGAESFYAALSRFLETLLDDTAALRVQTSGSTGRPKPFWAEKRRMAASARMTCSFLGLEPGEKNLLAMPLDYIAGKMVVVRSVVCGLDLVVRTPKSDPFDGLDAAQQPLGLCAVTPMQAVTILKHPQSARAFLESRNILIGGGAVDEELFEALQAAKGAVYSTYGMTETLSHVALRRLKGPAGTRSETHYKPLPGVKVSLSAKGTLVIAAPAVASEPLTTNDIAEIAPEGAFRILGRLDNVINTGGIKVQIETVEAKLARVIPCPFAITARTSHTFGHEVVLLVEGDPAAIDFDAVCAALGRYEKPHAVFGVERLPRTETGKTARRATRELAERLSRGEAA